LPWGEVAVPVHSHPHPLRVYPSKDPYNPLKEKEALYEVNDGERIEIKCFVIILVPLSIPLLDFQFGMILFIPLILMSLFFLLSHSLCDSFP
jgi:hypothetical protein